MTVSRQMIADGHDNIDDLAALRNLHPSDGLFARFHLALKSQYKAAEAKTNDSRSLPKKIGLQNSDWDLGFVFEAEAAYLEAHFGDAVTVFDWHPPTQLWKYFNATLILPVVGIDCQLDRGTWTPYVIKLRDYEEIEP